jgi:hypothetical protein
MPGMVKQAVDMPLLERVSGCEIVHRHETAG